MTKSKSPRAQAKRLVIRKARHGKSRHLHKEKSNDGSRYIFSIATEQKYRGNVARFIVWLRKENIQTASTNAALLTQFLEIKATKCRQKTVDGYRQSFEMVFEVTLPYVLSKLPTEVIPRAYEAKQVDYLCELASPAMRLAIQIAHHAGLRPHELDTLAPASVIYEDKRDWLNERFVGREVEIRYVVTGKGGLKRTVALPASLAEVLEKNRLDKPITRKQRGILYKKYYAIPGGQSFSQQFTRLSKSAFNWSNGAHGLRHAFAKRRLNELQMMGFVWHFALEILAQEMGHFSIKNTLMYLR